MPIKLGRPKKLTEKDVADIIRRYDIGNETLTAIAEDYNCNRATISRAYKRIEAYSKKERDKCQKDDKQIKQE